MKPNILVYPEDLWQAQDTHLGRADVETMSFGFLGVNRYADTTEYLLYDVYLPRDEEFARRTAAGVALRVDSVCHVMQRVKNSSGLLDVHTHPAGVSHFSGIDDDGHQAQMRNVFDFSPHGALVRMVKDRQNYCVEVTDRERQPRFDPVDLIKIVGERGFRFVHPVNSRWPLAALAPDDLMRHARTLEFCKVDALAKVRNTHIGIVGAGGNGSALVNQLKSFPFQKWTLVDKDILEPHNANRFFGFNEGDEGKYKVDVLARELRRVDRRSEVEAIRTMFPSAESLAALKGCDLLIVAPDHHTVRYAVSQFAMRYLKPLIELGSGIILREGKVAAMGSQVRFQRPTAAGQCIVCSGVDVRRLDPPELARYKRSVGYVDRISADSGRVHGNIESPGSVVTLNSVAAAVAAHLILNYLGDYTARLRTPSYIAYDEMTLTLSNLTHLYKKDPACLLCGRHEKSFFGKGDFLPKALEVAPVPEEEVLIVSTHAKQEG